MGRLIPIPVTLNAGGDNQRPWHEYRSETNNGNITAKGGMLDITGNVIGSGTLTVASGAFLQLEGTIAATKSVIFASGVTL